MLETDTQALELILTAKKKKKKMPSSVHARIKQFLRQRRASDKDQDDTPKHMRRKAFPAGIKPLWNPDNGAIECVPSYIRKHP